MDWKRGEVASRVYCFWNKVPFGGLGAGAGGWGAGGWVLLGWTGLVLSCTAQNPARLVYGSAALVASLRGQQSHFATLPTKSKVPFGLGAVGGWVLLGSTGLVLPAADFHPCGPVPATTQNPARLVYGSAALVAALRGPQSHFATLPMNLNSHTANR